MKKILLLSLFAGIIYITASSWASGPSGTAMAEATAKNGCGGAGCHGTQTSLHHGFILLKEEGQTSTVSDGKYKPNAKYTINLIAHKPATNKYGYIMLVTDDATNMQAGTLSNTTSNPDYKVSSVNGFQVAEQPMPIDPDPNSGELAVDIEWTAPAKGAGDVTINVAVNLCNGNGSADTGDHWVTMSETFSEGWPASVENISNTFTASIYPNPAVNTLNINLANSSANNYTYAIYGINGAVSTTGSITGNSSSVDVASLPAGIHILKLTEGEATYTTTFSKQ